MSDMHYRIARYFPALDLCGSSANRGGLYRCQLMLCSKCKRKRDQEKLQKKSKKKLTSDTGQQLPSKALNLAVRERNELVALQKVEDTLAKQIHDDTYVTTVVKGVAKVDAAILVLGIVSLEGSQDPQFNSRRISVFLNRTYDLDGDELVPSPVTSLDDFSKCPLTEHLNHLI